MKKQLNQSTICNIMAITSCLMALLIFLAGAFTAITFFGVRSLSDEQTALDGKVRELITVVNTQKDMLRSYTQQGSSLFLDMYNEKAVTAREIDRLLEEMQILTVDPTGQLQLQTITQSVRAMQAAEQNALSLVQASRLGEAQELAFGRDYGMMIDAFKQSIADFEMGMAKGIGALIERQSNRVMILGIFIEVLCILMILMQISNAITTKKMIIKPLIKLKAAMVSMCAGHLSGDLGVAADQTEMGELAGAMLEMRSRISSYITEIDFVLHRISQKDISVQVQQQYVGDFEPIHSSLTMIIQALSETFSMLGRSIDQISSGADHVSSAAQALAEGAAEQADAVEQLSSALGQVSNQIQGNAANATEANVFAAAAEDNLHSSNQQMVLMVNAMNEISGSSAEIAKIIKTIEDIAFQTNILALNAAVEAARAGAAGKGFAVVADEVRNLANKSSEAAKQTNGLIEGSVKSVENGVKIASDTASSLAAVVAGAQQVTALIAKISHASEEQSQSIVQINQGVDQISAVVQTNSATSQQSAAASEELSSQSGIMKSMVNAYKLQDGAHHTSSSQFVFQ